MQKDKATRAKQEMSVAQKQCVPSGELRGQNMAVLPTDGIRADWRGGERAWQASSNVFQVGRLSFG